MPKGRTVCTGALEPEERARLAGRHAEPLAGIALERGHPGAAMQLPDGYNAEQPADLGIEPLLHRDRTAQPGIELVGISLGEAIEQWARPIGEGMCLPETVGGARICRWLGERGYRLAVSREGPGIASLDRPLDPSDRSRVQRVGRRNICPRAVRFIRSDAGIERDRRQHLGGDELHALPGGKLLAGHAARQLTRTEPHRVDDRRTADLHVLAAIPIGIVCIGSGRPGLDRPDVHNANLTRQRVGVDAKRVGGPLGFVLRLGDADDEANLRPWECAGEQRPLERRELGQTPVDAREILERAGGEPYPLKTIVAQTCEAERLPGASSHELARNGRKHPP
jgi:hypothetical protein